MYPDPVKKAGSSNIGNLLCIHIRRKIKTMYSDPVIFDGSEYIGKFCLCIHIRAMYTHPISPIMMDQELAIAMSQTGCVSIARLDF